MKPQKITEQMFIEENDIDFGAVMCIDPGLGGTGIAFWQELCKPMDATDPDHCMLASAREDLLWLTRVKHITDEVVAVIKTCKPDWVVIEFPELWASSEKSFTAAARGDLFKLTYLVGEIGREVWGITFRPPVLVTAGQWKAQMRKPVVHARIKRALGLRYEEHIADAVGMGLSIMGAL